MDRATPGDFQRRPAWKTIARLYGLDVHKESITFAYALGMGEVNCCRHHEDESIACAALQSKAACRIVYEAGPAATAYRGARVRLHGVRTLTDSQKARRTRQNRPPRCDQARALAARRRPVGGVRAQRGRRSIPGSGACVGERQGRPEACAPTTEGLSALAWCGLHGPR